MLIIITQLDYVDRGPISVDPRWYLSLSDTNHLKSTFSLMRFHS